ncbi:MAG TPA: GntR family transcriptional regulator [Bryobacteraceae bacterium]|jgi:DNA-binding transcriptional regulator YhcF (GntR family)
MRFWITRNSEQPIREQLVRQVVLGILSEDLPAGHRLPSTRSLARRHKIHSNTVSAAYQDLLHRGWIELRRGSGLYVKPLPASGAGDVAELDTLVTKLIRDARALGHEPGEVLDRLEWMVRPRHYERVVIAEPERGMREILEAEASDPLGGRVQSVDVGGLVDLASGCVVTSLASRAAAVRGSVPHGTPCVTLRLNSVRKSLESQPRLPANTMLAIVSRSFEFRSGARTMLVAVGLHPDSICDVDASLEGWRQRLGAGSLVVADVVAAREVPATFDVKIFRMIAESSLAELGRYLWL